MDEPKHEGSYINDIGKKYGIIMIKGYVLNIL